MKHLKILKRGFDISEFEMRTLLLSSYDAMLKGAEQIMDRAKTDALFMSCTNLRVLDHIEKLESILGIPVICSNQAMFWHAMV